MSDADVIVVGSGHNGLTAALRLARAGWRVIVLERNAVIGGAVRTAEVTRPGYRHDLYATNLSLFKSSLVWREHQAELEAAGLRFITCHEAFASVYRDGRAVRVSTDAARTASEFARCSPADRDGWEKVVAIYRRVAPHILPLTNMPLPSVAAARQLATAAWRLRGGLLDLRDTVLASSRRFVDRFFRTEEAKGALLPWAFHLDFPPDIPGGAAFAFVSSVSGHLNGLLLAQGGAEAIVTALGRLIAAHGGVIHTGTEVSEILVKNGRAVGVRTTAGEVITATRTVIANVTPPVLFGRLLASAPVPQRLRAAADRFRYGPGVFMVHLALSRPVEWAAGDDLWRYNYVHLNGRADEIATTYAQCERGLLPSRAMMVVAQPTHADPSRAPPGCAAIRLQVRAVPARIAGDASDTIRGRDWASVKDAFAERVIEQLAEHAPGLRDLILARHVMSPEDFERENPNLIGGDCVSGSHHLDQNYLARPFRRWTRYRTPIEGLVMIGASTWPGGGVNAASGFLAAEDLLMADLRGTAGAPR